VHYLFPLIHLKVSYYLIIVHVFDFFNNKKAPVLGALYKVIL